MTDYVMVKRSDLLRWAEDFVRDNDPGDDTDVVTPFDDYLLRPPAEAQPVAWFPTYGNGKLVRNYGDGSPVPASKTKEEAEQAKRCHLGANGPVIPLYAHPPPSAPVGVEAVDAAAWIEVLELPEGFRVAEHLPGVWEYQFNIEDEADEDSDRMVSGASWNHPALAAIAAWGHAYDALAQQPAAPVGVEGLPEKWRREAPQAKVDSGEDAARAYREAVYWCAFQLEAALAAAAKGVE